MIVLQIPVVTPEDKDYPDKIGRSEEVLEKGAKVGLKILVSGGGRCNFTNLFADPRKQFLSQNPHFCISAMTRYEPSHFIDMVEASAHALGHSVMRLPSGAGHDAQMFARVCPTAMVFTPSVNGLSHNPAEHTDPSDIEAGANVMLQTMLTLANGALS